MTFQGHKAIDRPDGNTDESWHTYICGHCGTKVSGAVVAYYNARIRTGGTVLSRNTKWTLCTNCAQGSVIVSGNTYPNLAFGPTLRGLPDEIASAYTEARNCMSVHAYSAAELICRKILMYIAVEKGAEEGKKFAQYLKFLEDVGYVTPPMKDWVDLIRQHGNRSTHELELVEKDRAESTVMFTAELLRLSYEMEYMAKKYTPDPDKPE